MPVMEGKCALFKAFADVDAFPLCVKTHDVDELSLIHILTCCTVGGALAHNGIGILSTKYGKMDDMCRSRR